jgi:hypothetical protein
VQWRLVRAEAYKDVSFMNESFKASKTLMKSVNDSVSSSEWIVRRTNEECRLNMPTKVTNYTKKEGTDPSHA